jgi:TonB family protein
VQSAQAQTPAANPSAAAADIETPGQPGLTPPGVLKDVKAQYTEAALRGRIQGTVRLRAVVETDGSVSNVEVVKPLDAATGLDQAAVDALKQWRFKPGTREGKPVRVRIDVEMGFTIKPPSDMAWPQGVDPATVATPVAETATSGNLRLSMERPSEWKRPDARPPQWMVLQSADDLATVSISQPQTGINPQSLPPEAVALAVADTLRRGLVTLGSEQLADGRVQSRTAAFWVWSAHRTTSFPPGITADGAREMFLWVFAHADQGHEVGAMCTVVIPRGFEVGQAEERTRRAAAECSAIVNSIAIQ